VRAGSLGVRRGQSLARVGLRATCGVHLGLAPPCGHFAIMLPHSPASSWCAPPLAGIRWRVACCGVGQARRPSGQLPCHVTHVKASRGVVCVCVCVCARPQVWVPSRGQHAALVSASPAGLRYEHHGGFMPSSTHDITLQTSKLLRITMAWLPTDSTDM
jgi:hypothetical protein